MHTICILPFPSLNIIYTTNPMFRNVMLHFSLFHSFLFLVYELSVCVCVCFFLTFSYRVEYIVSSQRYKLVILFIIVRIIGRTVALLSDLVINSFLLLTFSNLIYLKLTYLYTPAICKFVLSKPYSKHASVASRVSLGGNTQSVLDLPIFKRKRKIRRFDFIRAIFTSCSDASLARRIRNSITFSSCFFFALFKL